MVETTAHSGTRPTHAEWQGQIFSRSGKSRKYPDFVKVTGYGTGEGLGGWNCSHSFAPYIEGMPRTYTPEMLKSYQAKDYEYNGEKLTLYEAMQKQREIERNLRRWKRENLAMKAAGQDTTQSAGKIAEWQERQKDFLSQTGLRRQSDREQVAGWGRSEAGKATYDAKILRKMEADAIMKAQSSLPKRVALPDTVINEAVDFSLVGLDSMVPAGVTLKNVYAMAGPGTKNQIADWPRLYNLYGGDPSQWNKMSGEIETDNNKNVVHWYERNGVQVEAKPKGWKKL